VEHLSEGTLRRMYDDPDALTAYELRHYANCESCKAAFAAVSDDARAAVDHLAVPAGKFDAESALRQIKAAPAPRPRFGFRLPVIRPASRPMFAGALAAIAVVAMVITAFAQLLPIFQPTTVTPVPVRVADFQTLPDLGAYGTVTWTQKPDVQFVLTAADAEKLTGLTVPSTGTLPSTVSTTVTYAAMTQATGVFTFNASMAAAEAAKTGKSLPAMPSGMDGSQLILTVGPAIVEIFGNINSSTASDPSQLSLPQLIIAESAVPVVTSTQVTVKQLEEFLLAQPGLSPQLAEQIKAIGDPTHTLPIPVPIEYVSSKTVKVQNADGVELGDNSGIASAVIWVNDNVVYGVAGSLHQDQVLTIANGLH
jgi:hypothetical protein